MTVPPYTEDPEGSRPYFRQLRQIRDSIAARNLPHIGTASSFYGHVARFRSSD